MVDMPLNPTKQPSKRLNSSIWPIAGTLTGTNTPGQIGPVSKGNEGVLHIPPKNTKNVVESVEIFLLNLIKNKSAHIMRQKNLMVRFQKCWGFGEYGVPLHGNRSQVHPDLVW